MADLDDLPTDQHFCLRWNNFQANITSQFDALRCDEDFTDVTIACDGQRLLAHKVVLSACSPYFKELFKANPCSHPIVFMRDVEARHIIALMEFMYVGEVNISQAHLSTFLKTAESLKIRGLTDTSSESDQTSDENSLYMKPQHLRTLRSNLLVKNKPKNIQIIPTNTVTTSQDIPVDIPDLMMPNISSPAPKRSKSETEIRLRKEDSMTVNPFALQSEARNPIDLLPKMELPEYISDDDNEPDDNSVNFYAANDSGDLIGSGNNTAQSASFNGKDIGSELSSQGKDNRRLHSLDPRPCEECGKVYSNLSNLRQHMKLIHYPTYVSCHRCNKQFKTDLYLRRHILSSHRSCEIGGEVLTSTFNYKFNNNLRIKKMRRRRISDHWTPYGLHQSSGFADSFYDISPRLFEKREPEKRNKLVKLGEGIEICEDQLRSVKWSDYRKLTRGLATILFSPAELATCSVTGQRWSRAGNGERPVKPALDRAKVQAIISYVAARFPMVEISRIKQVLAYKCKENSTAFKMKAVRFYGHGEQHSN